MHAIIGKCQNQIYNSMYFVFLILYMNMQNNVGKYFLKVNSFNYIFYTITTVNMYFFKVEHFEKL